MLVLLCTLELFFARLPEATTDPDLIVHVSNDAIVNKRDVHYAFVLVVDTNGTVIRADPAIVQLVGCRWADILVQLRSENWTVIVFRWHQKQ